MKVNAIGLETTAKLNIKEFSDLEKKSLYGKIVFRDVREDHYKRDIDLEISYSKKQKELLEIYLTPKDSYFGKADKIKLSINEQFYDEVKEYGSCGTRFWHGGKFEICLMNK